MTEPVYRQATEDDAGAIAAIGSQVIDELGEASGLPPYGGPSGQGPMTPAAVSERIAGYGEDAAMFVCQAEKGLSAFAVLEPDSQEDGCAVMGVWVLPAARRRGIGRELALMALEFARSVGYSKVRGTLPRDNEAALSFFSEIGALAQVVGGGMQYELPL